MLPSFSSRRHGYACDIAFIASQFARFCASAGPSHWAALHREIGYLEANPSFKLTYQRGGSDGLGGFADSDWGNSITRRSTTVSWHGSTAVRSCGDPRCRRLDHSRPLRQSTIRRRRWKNPQNPGNKSRGSNAFAGWSNRSLCSPNLRIKKNRVGTFVV